jgi:hypothetical protein
MKFLSAIILLAVSAAAAPSPGFSKRQGALIGPLKSQGPLVCDDPSRAYCFDEVVWGKSMSSFSSFTQSILLQSHVSPSRCRLERYADSLQTKITRQFSTTTVERSTLMTLSAATDACVSLFRLIIARPRLAPGTRRSSVQRRDIALRIDAITGAKKGCVSDGRL